MRRLVRGIGRVYKGEAPETLRHDGVERRARRLVKLLHGFGSHRMEITMAKKTKKNTRKQSTEV